MSPAPRRPQLPADQEGLLELLGGPRGLVDAGVPGAVFAAAYTLTHQDLRQSLVWALGSSVVLVAIGLFQRRSIQQSVAGLVGVALMAAVSVWTGQAKDFFLPSLIKNAAYFAVYLVSILIRWPLIGVLVGPLMGEGLRWRQDPQRMRGYTLASAAWAAMFGIRFAVQLPLYLAGQVGALGIAGIPLGLPLFLPVLWLTFVLLRRYPATPVVREPAADPVPVPPSPDAG